MSRHELRKKLENYGPEAREAYALFTTAGSSAPTVQDSQGIETIARSGTGTFLLTFRHAPKSGYYVVNITKQFTTDAQTIVVSAQSASAKTVEIKTVTAASANTAVDTTGMLIHVTAILRMQN